MKQYFRIISQQQRPVKFLLSRILMRSGISRFLTIRYPEFGLRFYPSPLMASMWIDPDYSRPEEWFFRSYVRSGDIIIDVGANIGIVTLLSAKKAGPTGHVFAIEANPRIFNYLQGNVAFNRLSSVTCFHAAVSDVEGSIAFTDHSWDEVNSVVTDRSLPGSIRVPARRLDDLIPPKDQYHLLKIDVEGYEKFVLNGAQRILRSVQCVYFESNKEQYSRFGYSFLDIHQQFENTGFNVYRMVDEGVLEGVGPSYESITTENLIAVKDMQTLKERMSVVVR